MGLVLVIWRRVRVENIRINRMLLRRGQICLYILIPV